MGYFAHALTLAFYFLLREDIAESQLFDAAMWQTVRLGGDTDTNAAIVGGLIGAAVGRKNIDRNKIDKVLSCDLSQGEQFSRPKICQPNQGAEALI